MFVRKLLWLGIGLSLLPAAAQAGDKLSKDEKKWLEEEVSAIILPSEEKLYKDLKKQDRPEFEKIFWARRDPNPDLESVKPDNAYRAEFDKARVAADERFKGLGRPGSLTDCGRVFLVLGEPDDVRPEGLPEPGRRTPENWVYRNKPSSPVKFTGGQVEVGLDASCQLPPGSSRFRDQLQRIAEVRIIRPDLDYRFGKDGRLVKLVDLLPKPSPARTLLKEGRQDFEIATEDHYLKVADGGTALVGLVQGDAAGLNVQEAANLCSGAPDTVDCGRPSAQCEDQTWSCSRNASGTCSSQGGVACWIQGAGGQTVKLTVAAQATDAEGKVAAGYEQPTSAVVLDGRFLASYRLGLKPGKYTVRAAAIEESSKKGAVVDHEVEAPDFNSGGLSATLIITSDLQEGVSSDPAHPFNAFLLGESRIVPRFGATFSKADSLYFFYQYYDARLDEQTAKASVVASVSMKKGDKPVARAGDQPYDAVVSGNIVGPVSLEKYEPGQYSVELKATDNVAQKTVTISVPFEIK